jgi:hypothetical protein
MEKSKKGDEKMSKCLITEEVQSGTITNSGDDGR